MEEVQPVYAQPMQDTSPMTVKDWLLTMFITAIPLVGLIMLFVWAFGSGNNLNKANYAKAALIWLAIIFVLYIVIFMLFIGLIFGGGNKF